MINAKHQIWVLPLIGGIIGGVSDVLGADPHASLGAVAIGILSGLARYFQHALPDTGTEGIMLKKKKEIGQHPPLDQ